MTQERQLTVQESELVGRIADRAVNHQLADGGKADYRREDIYMDVAGCHKLLGLDLEGLVGSDDFTFVHDVWGIKRHFDRDNGRMYGCFLPRTIADE